MDVKKSFIFSDSEKPSWRNILNIADDVFFMLFVGITVVAYIVFNIRKKNKKEEDKKSE